MRLMIYIFTEHKYPGLLSHFLIISAKFSYLGRWEIQPHGPSTCTPKLKFTSVVLNCFWVMYPLKLMKVMDPLPRKMYINTYTHKNVNVYSHLVHWCPEAHPWTPRTCTNVSNSSLDKTQEFIIKPISL